MDIKMRLCLFQVEGAVTRAYNRWIEDLTSLPEYQAALQTEKEKWEQLQEKHTQQKVWKSFCPLFESVTAVVWVYIFI